jgi:putative MFS transporter
MDVTEKDLLALVDRANLTPRYWATFALIVAQFIFEIFDFFIVSFLVSVIAPQWHLTFGQITIILLSAGIGAIIGALGFGWISDTFGRKAAIVGGGIVYTVSAGAVALIPEGSWILFALLRFLVGIGYGGAGTSQFALIAEYTPTRLRTLMTSSLGIPASIGIILASLIVSSLLPILGWRGTAALGVLPVFIAIALAFIAPESVLWLVSKGHFERARQSISEILGIPLQQVPTPTARQAAPPAISITEVFADQRRFWLIVLVQLGLGTAFTGVLLWGPTVIAQLLHISPREAATYFIYVGLMGLVGRIFFTYLPHKIGRIRSGLILTYAGAAMLACAAVFHNDYWGAVPLFMLFLVIGEFFFDGGFSNVNPYAAELYPVRLAALGMGVSQAAGGTGKILGPLVLGLLAGAGNLVTPQATEQAVTPGFLFLAACCLLAAIGYTFLGIETHGRALSLTDTKPA